MHAEVFKDQASAKRVLSRLRQTGNKQRRDSLTRLEAACDALDQKNADLTFAEIGRTTRAMFQRGPYESSIKNDPGFTEYVQARRNERRMSGEVANKGARKSPTSLLIERIPDETLRARMRNFHDAYLTAQRKLTDISSLLVWLAPETDVETLIRRSQATPNKPVSVARSRGSNQCAPESIEALKSFLAILNDSSALARFNLIYDGKRVRKNKGIGDELISAKTVSGLVNLLRELSMEHPTEIIDVELN